MRHIVISLVLILSILVILTTNTNTNKLSIGINLESYQPEADSINQAMPEVNIALSARSFSSMSNAFNNKRNIEYDTNGYPLYVTSLDRVESHMLYNLQPLSIPKGIYTVLHDGEGKLSFSGLFSLHKQISNNEYQITISISKINYDRGVIRIIESTQGNYIKNLRVIMPGGRCNDNIMSIYKHTDCSDYVSFVSMYKNNPDIHIFNPDYLRFLKDFNQLRVMNFHETSQKPPRNCNSDCMDYKAKWKDRSKLTNYSFGSSYRIRSTFRKGAPWESSIQLVNTLYKLNKNVELYLVLPFNLTDKYILSLASLLNNTLNKNIPLILEYNNESWNPRFHGAKYVRLKGRIHNPEKDGNLYREGYKFYSTDAIRIFKLFNINFPRNRTSRVLGSFQWNPHLTKGLLEYNDGYKHIDAIAIGTYFYMCYSVDKCKDSNGMLSFETSSEIETFLLNPKNRYGIPALLSKIEEHYAYTSSHDIELISYEGGLHLTVQNLQHKHASHYVKVLNKFNDSQHAYSLYSYFLTEVAKQNMITKWVAFTSPQSYHKWGPFGVKQTLNGTGPKYEAIIDYKHGYKK